MDAKEVISLTTFIATVVIGAATLMIQFTILVLKIIEVARLK